MSVRFLVSRPDHLGDVLLTLPAVAALRQTLPDARITLLLPPNVSEVVRHCPWVDEVYPLPFPPLVGPSDPRGWQEVVDREGTGLRGRFDVALMPRPDDGWSGAIAEAAGIPVRIGYDHPRARPYLTEALPFPPIGHVVEHSLTLFRVAARKTGATELARTGWGPFLVATAEGEIGVEETLGPLGRGRAPIVLHPGSGWPLKNWPASRWGELARALAPRYEAPIVVAGGAGEKGLVDAVVMESRGRALGVTTLSLGGLVALHRRARLVVATDSGPLHLAALVGTPVVGLYGPADPGEFGPWCPPEGKRVVRVDLPCSPCRTMIDPPCGATVEPACVMGIAVERVLSAAAELLDLRRSQAPFS